MSWNTILGVACVASFALPIAVICYNRFHTHRSLAALMIYYAITALYNAMALGLIPAPGNFITYFGVVNNYLDVPLMLTALIFFCAAKQKQRIVRILTLGFIAYEILIAIAYGFSPASIVYVMGPGIVLILGHSFYLFLKQVKFSIVHGKNQGRSVMLASILFMYASYALIYFFYYIMQTPYKADAMLLYFIASAVSSIMMAIGLHLMRRRMKELASLKTTRRELALFFGKSA